MIKRKRKRKIDMLFITASISTSLVLLLVGIITSLLIAADDASDSLKREMRIEVVIKESATDDMIANLERSLRGERFCNSIEYISKSDALQEMSIAMGVNPTDFLEYNPFYASFNITLNADYALSDSIVWIEKSILNSPVVEDVNYQKEILDVVNSNIRKVTIALLLLAAILSLISFTLINNTIKLTIYSQRFLLYSMKLVGAKWSFIRRPFIIHNLWIGLTSGVLASLLFYFGINFASRYERSLTLLLDTKSIAIVIGVMIIMGLLLTSLCALKSVNRFLRMKSGELHYV